MAKAIRRVFGAPGFRSPYKDWQDLPWAKIESATKAQFSSVERQEIHGCVEFALITRHHIAEGTKQADIDDFSTKLLKIAREMNSFFDEYLPEGRIELSDGIRHQGDGAHWKLGVVGGFAAQHSFEFGRREYQNPLQLIVDARNAVSELIELLTKEFEVSSQTTQNEPDADSLAWFVGSVLGNATRTPARSKEAGAYEHSRWGISVGPNTLAFRRLAMLALGRPVTKNQMESAFNKVKASRVG